MKILTKAPATFPTEQGRLLYKQPRFQLTMAIPTDMSESTPRFKRSSEAPRPSRPVDCRRPWTNGLDAGRGDSKCGKGARDLKVFKYYFTRRPACGPQKNMSSSTFRRLGGTHRLNDAHNIFRRQCGIPLVLDVAGQSISTSSRFFRLLQSSGGDGHVRKRGEQHEVSFKRQNIAGKGRRPRTRATFHTILRGKNN